MEVYTPYGVWLPSMEVLRAYFFCESQTKFRGSSVEASMEALVVLSGSV